MALIQWQEKYTVRVEKFDSAHKKIIDYINELFEILKNRGSNEDIQKILDNLEDYTKTHFKEEEKVLAAENYPDLEAHKLLHRKLIEDLDNLRAKTDVDPGLLNTQVLYFLKDWLRSHIMEIDQKYTNHLNSHGIN